MADPFVAEIRIVGFSFPPTGWAFCNGQLLPLSQNTALFALLGTTYGGDGKSTFALPDLQGMAALHPGRGEGLSERALGEMGGTESVALLQSEMPAHEHALMASGASGSTSDVGAETSLASGPGGTPYAANASSGTSTLAPPALSAAGSSLPHNNMMPYLALNYVIALQGVFPARQ